MNHFWAGFEKSAEKKNEGHARAALAGAAGAAAVHKSLDPLTGRITVYHGTNPEAAAKIRKDGFDPKRGGTGAASLRDDFKRQSHGKTHVTTSKGVARLFADRRATAAMANGSAVTDPVETLHASGVRLNPLNNKGVVKASIPYGAWTKGFEADKHWGTGNRPKGEAATTTKRIPSKYVKGGKDYLKTRVTELKGIKGYIKAHPGRFARGAAGALAGAGGLAVAGHHFLSHLKKHQEKTAAKMQSPIDLWLAEELDAEAELKVVKPLRMDPREVSESIAPSVWHRDWQ